jgi:signal transduction histidine kinase
MNAEVLLATAAAVASVYAALFHGWVFVQHRTSRDHLWVAVTAVGVAAICFGTAEMYVGRSTADAFGAQRLQAFGAPALTVGLLRFTAFRFHVSARRFLRSADVFFTAIAGLVLLAPALLFEVDRPPQQISGLGVQFLQLELSPLTKALLAVALCYFVTPVIFCVRAQRRGERGASSLLVALGIYFAAALNDSAVSLGVWGSPYLMPTGGYLALVLGISSILLRDFVLTTEEAERLGAKLQELVRARADSLRAVDLQLARGEQLAAIGTLAAGVAHEINNPLAYVNANLNQLAALWRDEQDPAEVQELLGECREGLARVSAIAGDLLRMARDGASEQNAFDLSEVVRSVVPLVEREAGAGVRLATELGARLVVRGSPRLVGQVALNLVLNAIQASAGARPLAREPRAPAPDPVAWEPRIDVCTRPARGGAELVVRDNGPGIPPEVLGRVFEPSFTSKPLGVGTGLGLALVRLIVTRHGGEIRAESGPSGTAITVWLPVLPAAV